MKSIILLACVLSTMGGASTPTNVYVTAHGGKYHTHKDCRYIKGKDIKTITLEQARKDNKSICKVCQVKDLLNNK